MAKHKWHLASLERFMSFFVAGSSNLKRSHFALKYQGHLSTILSLKAAPSHSPPLCGPSQMSSHPLHPSWFLGRFQRPLYRHIMLYLHDDFTIKRMRLLHAYIEVEVTNMVIMVIGSTKTGNVKTCSVVVYTKMVKIGVPNGPRSLVVIGTWNQQKTWGYWKLWSLQAVNQHLFLVHLTQTDMDRLI